MEDYRINLNYAKALFTVAGDMGQLDAVNADMRLVNSVCAENHVLVTIFANPVLRESKKVAILKDLFGDKVSAVSMAFLSFVVKKRRTVNLRGISDAFIDLYRDANNIMLSKLVVATDIDEASTQSICDALGRHVGKTIELQTKVDPSIIGGMSLTFDGNMYDATLSSKIAELRKEFSKNVYESKL